MIKVTLNQALEGELSNELTELMGAAAVEAGIGLSNRLSYRSGKRTGTKWPQNKRRSSAKGEYPQEQTGELRSWVDADIEGPLTAMVGLNTTNSAKWQYLRDDPKGGRQPMFMYFEGRDSDKTLRRMAKGIRKAIGSR